MSDNLFNKVYNPDVLSCLANLSNDEVFTPPEIVNQMLDMLPQELFSNPDTTFLDPACKTGVFLREIAKRLIKGLEPQFPDLQERIDHIFHKQLFGIAITELTSLLSRRGIYCSKYPNSDFSVTKFETAQGNIRFKRIDHTWVNGRCKYCGTNKTYDRGEELETHAYEFIHTDNLEKLFNMKFDVIISNPPYQLTDGSGGSTDAAMPIYHKFIEQTKRLNSRFIVMIIPSKWMVGGRGLEKFRDIMINDDSIREIHDFEDSKKCFSGVHLDGGICYFLRDSQHHGLIDYYYTDLNENLIFSKRCLKNKTSPFVIRDERIMSILDKTSNDISFSTIVSTTKPYGIRKDLFNSPERYPLANLQKEKYPNSFHIFGVRGLKGGARRTDAYISRSVVPENSDIKKYKIFFTTSYSTNAIVPPEPILAGPDEICTETFLSIGPFNSKEIRDNCEKYMKTNFFRFLLYYGKGSMQVTKAVFALIPLQDFSKSWTDEELYAKYGLTQEEIDFIESMIRPME